MYNVFSCLLFTLLVVIRIRDVDAALAGGTCSAAAGICTGEPNADTCTSNACVCNLFFEESGDDCVAEANCAGSSASDIATACGTPNTVCDTTVATTCVCAIHFAVSGAACMAKTCDSASSTTIEDQCIANAACTAGGSPTCTCAVNYEAVVQACTAIACTTANEATKCTDGESYCEIASGAASGTCACKKNFAGTNALSCLTISCSDDAGCTGVTNSACTVSGATAVCGCDTLYNDDGSTGACSAQKTCTVATVTADCGTNTVCEELQSVLSCFCRSNYMASATGCVQKTCSGTDTANCDADSQCVSGNCGCADNFVINGRVCECTSTGFSLVGGACKKSCNATSQCGTNGACSNSFCECEPNYEGNGALACTQIACSGTITTNCAAKSSCESDKCVCTAGSFVTESDPLVCSGCEGIFCNFSLLMASLLMFFFSSKISE